ncbi:hypothetical protein NUW54_g7540 [Trametes sanguinea]|uniref:Uncharacterized protein n=1 Tax=Trametes sanguinea TaxID=158606 RepID=A0ACC1PKX8_9APHY|nr:hypothetical protein NUW54_g7540 [Trametes sanguinea]
MIAVESAALYLAFTVVFLVSYAIKAPINALWLAIATAAEPIATYLIIYRVADGKAWTQETVSAQTTTSILFCLQTGMPMSPKERVSEGLQTAANYGSFTLDLPAKRERVAKVERSNLRSEMAVEDQPSPELVRQEEEYLRKVHPTPEDIPGCMKLFDDFLLCNGKCSLPPLVLGPALNGGTWE